MLRMVPMFRPVLVALLLLAAKSSLAAPEYNPFRAPAGDRAPVATLIVGLRPDNFGRTQIAATTTRDQAYAEQRAAAAARVGLLAARSAVTLQYSHSIAPDTHVVQLPSPLSGDLLDVALASLRADSEVSYVEPNRRKRAHAVPNDPLFPPSNGGPGIPGNTGQWYLNSVVTTPVGPTTAATSMVGAWDVTTGSTGLVIAVVDTGILAGHPDLAGRLLPGYDFVGDDNGDGANSPASGPFLTANDGNGWDSDPSDPGDWVTDAEVNQTNGTFYHCTTPDPTSGAYKGESSSWHGTRVAGMLGAATNNSIGIAGITWSGKILPVRALGKCGGFDSDIIAAMRWAGGLSVPGAPANPNPAKIINLSLGGVGACSATYRSAITDLTAAGVTVVASAGNEGGPIDEPANCSGVIGVTALRHVGTKVAFANVSGSIDGVSGSVAIAAPGGNCVNTGKNQPCLFSLDTLTNSGTQGPVTTPSGYIYTDQFNFNVGTSFSSPIVAGIVGLMVSVNPALTPTLLTQRLKAGARAFPNIATDSTGAAIPACALAVSTTKTADTSQQIECNCTTTTCGAGVADAAGAVAQAARPIVELAVSGGTSAGSTASFSSTGSSAAAGHTIASESWSIASYSSFTSPALSAASGTTSSLVVPACGAVTVNLTVTDDAGKTDSTTTTVGTPPAAGTTCPDPTARSGGGGGGALDGRTLAGGALAGMLLVAARRRRARTGARASL